MLCHSSVLLCHPSVQDVYKVELQAKTTCSGATAYATVDGQQVCADAVCQVSELLSCLLKRTPFEKATLDGQQMFIKLAMLPSNRVIKMHNAFLSHG